MAGDERGARGVSVSHSITACNKIFASLKTLVCIYLVRPSCSYTTLSILEGPIFNVVLLSGNVLTPRKINKNMRLLESLYLFTYI